MSLEAELSPRDALEILRESQTDLNSIERILAIPERQFVDQYADRVEFLEARRLLLFRGGCKGTVTGVFPVTNEQVEALVDLR